MVSGKWYFEHTFSFVMLHELHDVFDFVFCVWIKGLSLLQEDCLRIGSVLGMTFGGGLRPNASG